MTITATKRKGYFNLWITEALVNRIKQAAVKESGSYPRSVTPSALVRKFVEDGLARLARKDGKG